MELTAEGIRAFMGRKSLDVLELDPRFSRALRKHGIVYVEDMLKHGWAELETMIEDDYQFPAFDRGVVGYQGDCVTTFRKKGDAMRWFVCRAIAKRVGLEIMATYDPLGYHARDKAAA